MQQIHFLLYNNTKIIDLFGLDKKNCIENILKIKNDPSIRLSIHVLSSVNA